MDNLTVAIKSLEVEIKSLETAMQLNAERYERLCERYIQRSRQLQELREVAKASTFSMEIASDAFQAR